MLTFNPLPPPTLPTRTPAAEVVESMEPTDPLEYAYLLFRRMGESEETSRRKARILVEAVEKDLEKQEKK